MSSIKGKDIEKFVRGICVMLVELDVTSTEPGEDYDKDSLRDRFSVALLRNPSLPDLIHIESGNVIGFIDDTITAFGNIPCGSVKYIEALLSNPCLFNILFPSGKVMKA